MTAGRPSATPTVSIVIAAYNAKQYIETSVRSALDQSWRDLEVIVVDDGSADASAEVAEQTGDPRVRVVRQANIGQSAALNRGVRESRGAFIKFLDADDALNERHVELQLAALDNHDDFVASCAWGYFIDDPRQAAATVEQSNRNYDDPFDWLIDSLSLDEGMMGGWKWLIPRSVWDRAGGWNESLTLNNDFDFSIRLLLASRGVRYAPGAVYAYRKGVSGALSGTRATAAMVSAFETTEAGCANLLARENSPRVRRICADRWQWWLYQFYPDHRELAERAEREVAKLGGSEKRLEGGRMLQLLRPIVGWKGVRRLQSTVYRAGWGPVLKWKEQKRLATIARAESLHD